MENKQNIKDLIQKFYPHAKEKLGFDHPVRVIMRQDAENAKDSLGKTAYYDPAEKLIVLYVTDRHPKDVLRSFSHELVHHAQNCRGDLDDLSTDGHYAGDGKGREIEAEAYLLGNGFLVRDWEDGMKHKGVNKMKLTKSQLKGLIEQTVQNLISEKDADGDGSPAPPKWADPDDNDPKVKASLQKEEESVDEQGMVVKADVTLPPNSPAQRALDVLTDFINQSDAEDAEFQAAVTAMLEKLKEKGVNVASPDNTIEMDEQEELQPTMRGKQFKIEKEKKTGREADAVIKVAKDRRRKEEDEEDEENKHQPTSPADLVQPVGPNLEENNDTWYNSSLYESLKSKWAK